MKKALVFFGVIFLISCSSKLAIPTETDAERGASLFTEYDLQKLIAGKEIYMENCGLCHNLHQPKEFSTEKWQAITPKMVAKVNKKTGMEKINADQQELLIRYLLTMQSGS